MDRRLIVILLVVALALSGCLAGDDDVDSDDKNPDDGDGDGSSGNGDGDNDDNNGTGDGDGDNQTDENEEEEVNEPPTVGLDTDVEEGGSPLEVEFTLDAEDPNGDNLTWDLTIVDGDTIDESTTAAGDFPLTVTHEFTTNQYPNENFTIEFTLTDGEFSETANITITVTRAANDPQEGEVDLCAWHQSIPIVPGLIGEEEGPEIVQVEASTYYQVDADADVHIAFINEAGERVLETEAAGKVPPDSVRASICVPAAGAVVVQIPTPGATFTYQDGLAEGPSG